MFKIILIIVAVSAGLTFLGCLLRLASIRAHEARAKASLEIFHRLARDAMVYASRPRVTVMYHVASWPDEPVLIRTTADPFQRRSYVESQRVVAGEVVQTACLYLDGAEAPAEVGAARFPAEQTNVYVLKMRIEDIVREGIFLSFHDQTGRIRESRLPARTKHHA